MKLTLRFLTFFNNGHQIDTFMARILDIKIIKLKYTKMNIKEKYKELKDTAKQALLAGEMKLYMQLLNDVENLNLILVRANQPKR